MVYIRSNPLDYDTWRDAYGCHGWGYADLLPYFRRAEDQQRGESAYHGVGFYQLTQHEGRRWSTADGYLRPAMERNNLTVETDARVTRVLIEHGRAVGVRYLRQGTEREARARREVLLSGGAVNSPQLLMLSGVGPAEHLRDLGIEVVVDAPQVGEGLQDHPSFDLTILMCILLVIDLSVTIFGGKREGLEEGDPPQNPTDFGRTQLISCMGYAEWKQPIHFELRMLAFKRESPERLGLGRSALHPEGTRRL
jgi:choline dehydrogenase-like flavoprotein